MLIFSSICNVFFLILLRLTASTTTINIVLRPRQDESPIHDLSCKLSPDKMMKIILKPKAFNETYSTNFFQCGVDASIDEEKMVAEWNNQAIFNFLKSKDNDPDYQTKVHAVIKWDNSGQPVMGMKEEDEDGVYSLFIAPNSHKCDSQTLDRAVNMEEGFYPVFIGASNNFSDPQNKFLNEIKCLEKNYGVDKPSLCSTKLSMNHLTATSRIRTIQAIFNFAYNNGRNVNLNKIKQCKSETETKEAIAAMSNIFDIKPDCHFKETTQTVIESAGFAKVIIERNTSDIKSIIRVKTIFSSDDGSANERDVVPFNNFVVFDKSEKYSEVYITIKEDNVEESNEKFNLILQPFIEKRRKKRMMKVTNSKPTVITIAATLVLLNNQDTNGPFRVRIMKTSTAGKITVKTAQWGMPGQSGPLIRDIDMTDTSQRTFYKSVFSVKRNIPLTSVIKFEGKSIGTLVNTNLKTFKPALPRGGLEYLSDMREQVRPKEWYKDDTTRNARYENKQTVVPLGNINDDYTHEYKYKGQSTYTRGHLISSNLFRSYFIKERVAPVIPNIVVDPSDTIDIPYDYSTYLTNIFPQVEQSNSPNDEKHDNNNNLLSGNFDNWATNEIHEEQAMRVCFEKDINNNFHIAHGTIPSGNKAYILENTEWKDAKQTNNGPTNGPTNVNIPRYFYMAFCCSSGSHDFKATFHVKDANARYKDVTTTKFALFEHFIHGDLSTTVTADKGDKITTFDTVDELQKEITRLWNIENPTEKAVLFTNPVSGCNGFDVNL